MHPDDGPDAPDKPAANLLSRFTENTAVRRLARSLAGELFLVDREGDIVDPGVDPRIFTVVPDDLGPDRYAYVTLLMGGEAYLPGCLVVGTALRYHLQSPARLVCLVDDAVSGWARGLLSQLFDAVLEVPRLCAHETSYPEDMLSEAYRCIYTKLHLFDSALLPYERVIFVDADLLPLRCFDHLFTLPSPAAVIESVHPTSQYGYVHHMHGVRHGQPVPPSILHVASASDVRGGINAGLLVIHPDRNLFEDMRQRIQRPMSEWGPEHRTLYEAGVRYGFPEQHFLQVELQDVWTAIDPRFNSMRVDVPHSFGIHWVIGRKPWHNHGNPRHTVSQALWIMAWETLRLHHPDFCTDLEDRGLVTGRP
jgi:alpha-N-acetylglucosamine transferase